MSIEVIKSWSWPTPLIMRQLIEAATNEPRTMQLSESDRRDIVYYVYRLGEPIRPEHIECISKHLGISQREILLVLIDDVFPGDASMRRCPCGRPFASLHDADRQCAVCELDS